jgi:hypothetical protein
MVEITIGPDSPAVGRRVNEIAWPADCLVVAVTDGHELLALDDDTILRRWGAGDLARAQHRVRDHSARADRGCEVMTLRR